MQRNERQSIYERADPSRSYQAYQSMSGAIRVDNIRDGSSRSEQIELRVMIRLEQIRVKTSGGKTRQIGAEREHHGERENPCQMRKEKRSKKIRAESEKSGVEHSGASSVV